MNDTALSKKFTVGVSPWRSDLYEELHARPSPVLASPAVVSQIACLHGNNSHEDEINHLEQLCNQFGQVAPASSASCLYTTMGDFELRWEKHTEFSTFTFIRHNYSGSAFEGNAIDSVPIEWLEAIPGEVVSASHVCVLNRPADNHAIEELKPHFNGERLIGSKVRVGKAEVWTSFLAHDDGFSRFLIYNDSLNDCEVGRLVQRILEIESYRLVSLLALPLCKHAHQEINTMDKSLCETVEQVPDLSSHKDEKKVLGKLMGFSAQIERLRAKINYRSNATLAYSDLVYKRLMELNETRSPGVQTMSDFLERRYTPAIRTVMSASERLKDLSTRIDRATDLIRTKVDLEIERQNQTLLSSLDDRSRRQFSLQKTVESLSIVAISYYLVELIKMTVPATQWFGLDVSADDVAVFSVPMILIGVIIVAKVIRQRLKRLTLSEMDSE